WDGTQWSVVPSPNPLSMGKTTSAAPNYEYDGNFLYGVAAASSSEVWAVGSSDNGTTNHTLVLRWDGSAWAQLPSPSPSTYDVLHRVAVVGPSDAWAAGSQNTLDNTLIERYSPDCGTSTPLPTSISTSTPILTSTPASTGVPPTDTQPPSTGTAQD